MTIKMVAKSENYKIRPELRDDIIELFRLIGAYVHNNSVAHGFWDNDSNFGEKIAMIHSELSEMLEANRCVIPQPDKHLPHYNNEDIEWADTLIRMFDYGWKRQIKMGEALVDKHNFNVTREHKHGKKF